MLLIHHYRIVEPIPSNTCLHMPQHPRSPRIDLRRPFQRRYIQRPLLFHSFSQRGRPLVASSPPHIRVRVRVRVRVTSIGRPFVAPAILASPLSAPSSSPPFPCRQKTVSISMSGHIRAGSGRYSADSGTPLFQCPIVVPLPIRFPLSVGH